MKIFLESQKETSKLSGDVFWGCWDRMVAQKVEIKILFFENLLNPCTPPPWGSVHGSVTGGGGHPYQNVGHEIKTLKYFFKHPIKNILTIRHLKTFLETISGSGRG